MKTGTRERILAALEEACRAEWNHPLSLIRRVGMDSDDHCVRYGPSTNEIARLAGAVGGVLVTNTHVRRILHAESSGINGILSHGSPRRIRWWPVGMLAKLRAEK